MAARDTKDGAEGGIADAGMGWGSDTVDLLCTDNMLGSDSTGEVGGMSLRSVKQVRAFPFVRRGSALGV